MRTKTLHILLVVACILIAGCKKKEVIFTYSPAEPRAGQTITFTNGTSEGEKWEWEFGDGTSSASKNPSKVYKKAGSYTVTLKVDGKKNLTYSETLTVVDTVPQITLATDSVVYFMTPVKLHMSAYNPYSYKKTYTWELGENVELVDGELTDEYITVLFTDHDDFLGVSCVLTIGDAEYDCEGLFYVSDTTAPALLMVADQQLLCQRTFAYGEEAPVALLTAPAATLGDMAVEGDRLYLFSAGTTTSDAIWSADLTDYTTHRVVYNAEEGDGQGFRNGIVYDGMLYWTGEKDGLIYRVGENTRNCAFTAGTASGLLWKDVTTLGYGLTAGSKNTGLAMYNTICFFGYGNGIYRFTQSGTTESPILTDVAVTRLAIDALAKKIYYTSADGLSVCTLNGQNSRLISAGANGKGLCVDNGMNRLYWTEDDGVYYLPLIQSANNAFTDLPIRINAIGDVECLAVDPTPRYCVEKFY